MAEDHSPEPRDGALAGLRILDIGTFIAAPFAATLMAEHGAEVVEFVRYAVAE